MYVDPIILSGLDEYQKQTLFCKMREEQIRRWRVREQENESQPTPPKKPTPNKKNKNVSFREDNEGEPWVVIIEPVAFDDSDSDDSDLSMKKPGHEEEKQKARELAEIETIEIRRQYKEIITASDNNKTNGKKDEVDDGTPIITDDMQIYCSVDELRDRMKHPMNGIGAKVKNGTVDPIDPINQTNNIINFNFAKNPTAAVIQDTVILKEIFKPKPSQKMSQKIALWEQRVIGEKTTEIYQRLRKKQKEEAEQEAKRQEEAWKEQERKAKEADIQYRELARRAREEYRKSLTSEVKSNGVADTSAVNGTTTAVQNGTNGQHTDAKGLTNGHGATTNGINGVKPPMNGIKPLTNGYKSISTEPKVVKAEPKIIKTEIKTNNNDMTALNHSHSPGIKSNSVLHKGGDTLSPKPMNGLRNGIHSPHIVGASTKGPAPKPPVAQIKPLSQSPLVPQKPPSASPPSSLDALIPRPSSHDAMIQWYHDIEISKGSGLESIVSRLPCKWFYGLMSRTEAEHILESEPMGTFLVRLSEKIWGYAISYKDIDRCKHYLINASTGQYKFLGANQMNHDTLSKQFFSFVAVDFFLINLEAIDHYYFTVFYGFVVVIDKNTFLFQFFLDNLIKHHATVPITTTGNELLIRPCPRSAVINSHLFDGLF